MSGQTPSQTVGPFFHDALFLDDRTVLAGPEAVGQRIELTGVVTDGDGEPIPDAMLEIWQADGDGAFHPHVESGPVEGFCSFGRAPTDEAGRYAFTTVKPGGVPLSGGRMQAPHVNVHVFSRGLLIHAFTRVYFAGDSANESDPTLTSLPPEQAQTLLATSADGVRWTFDVRMQGEGETVFFEPGLDG